MKRIGIMLTALAIMAAGVLVPWTAAGACGMSDPCPQDMMAPPPKP